MKTRSLILFLMTISCILGNAQTSQMVYRPFAQDGKKWECQVGGIKENLYDNCIKGDTLIDGEVWKKVYNDDGKFMLLPSGDGVSMIYYYAAVRDVDKKVYAIAKGSTKPRLLYDFSLKKGDVVRCGMEGNAFGCLLDEGEQCDSLFGFEFKAYLKVERIDTISEYHDYGGNQVHRVFVFFLLDAYHEPLWNGNLEQFVIGNVIWIEGVGSYTGPFTPWMPLPQFNFSIRSCLINKDYIYGYPDDYEPYYLDWEEWLEEDDDVAAVSSNHHFSNGNSVLYNLLGFQMTRRPDRGIYIQNGRKFVKK